MRPARSEPRQTRFIGRIFEGAPLPPPDSFPDPLPPFQAAQKVQGTGATPRPPTSCQPFPPAPVRRLLGVVEQAIHLSQFFEPALVTPTPMGGTTHPPIHAWRIPSKGGHMWTPGPPYPLSPPPPCEQRGNCPTLIHQTFFSPVARNKLCRQFISKIANHCAHPEVPVSTLN